MAFYHFKQLPIRINGQEIVCESIDISQQLTTQPKYNFDSRISETELADSMYNGNLKLNYYITGQDYLKNYLYSNESQPISGNLAGLMFGQGYLSNYSLNIQPNSPILVNANIIFFDQLTGTLVSSSQSIRTGIVLRTSDITINSLSNFTQNTLNNFTRASFDYSAKINPSYFYYDTGTIPTKADNISIEERTLTTEIISDNTTFNLPISGEKFGSIFTFKNPFNTGIYETFGCSGLISSKLLNINISNPHEHTIKITQYNFNKLGGISGVVISGTVQAGQIIINSTDGTHPFINNNLNYVEKISLGDIQLTGYSILNKGSYDQISSPIPLNILDNSLLVQTSYGNYIWPNKLHFTYPDITITGLSQNTGNIGTNIYISGTNFYRISDVLFGGSIQSPFQIIDPQTIIATIPNGGISNPIVVYSNLRSKSGISQNNFYYQPTILNISPTTGVWKDTIIITGNNFSGITSVLFNNTPSFSFSILNNNLISAKTPETGLPFPSGNINIYGTGGHGKSISVYNPIVPIYNFSPLSGIPGTGINIYTKIDTGYLYPFQTSYVTGYASTNYTLPTGLLAWYGFDGNTNDYSSSGNNGTPINSPSFTYDKNNIIGCALSLDGVSQYVDLSKNDPLLNYNDSFSISVWWSGDSGSFFLGRGASNNRRIGWSIQMGNSMSSIVREAGNGGAGPGPNYYTVTGSNPSPNTGWNNTILVCDTLFNRLKLFNNGIKNDDISLLAGQTLRNDTDSNIGLQIGKCPSNNTYYNGNLDDVRIFNYPLGTGDAYKLYTGKVIYNQPYSGYINIYSGGYKVKLGGVDTRFFISGNNSTGILTGTLQTGTFNDYLYIYGSDGNLTYSNPQKFNVIGFPNIDYISPITISQYKYFNMLVVGENLGFFSNQSYYFAISGGISGDMQTYGTGNLNHSLNNDSILVNNIIVTGNTGYYDVIVQNLVSGFILQSGLLVNRAINQSNFCNSIFNDTKNAVFPMGENTTIQTYFNNFYNSPISCIDSSYDTFSIISSPTSLSGYFLKIYPVSVPYLNISSIKFNSSGWFTGFYTTATDSKGNTTNSFTPLPIGFSNNYSGSIQLIQNPNIKIYDSSPILLSGVTLTPLVPITGVTEVRIYPQIRQSDSLFGLPINEIQIY